jgi:KDO2-lipid IV(A) lauroyltransferase
MIKKIRYLFEALAVYLGMKFFGALNPNFASNFAAKLALIIGKRHNVQKLARKNMKNALPNLSDEEIERNLDGMWRNLGRIIGEYAHIAKISHQKLVEKYVAIDEKSLENVALMKESNKGGIIFSGHIGNWEIGPKCFENNGISVKTVYRPLNNPYVEQMTASIRGTKLIAKSAKGGREIIEAVKKGEYVIILADQKISEGELVRFFHDDAITTTSLARIALKYGVPLVPARSVRINDEFKFWVEVEKPLEFTPSGNQDKDVLDLTRLVNLKLEEWIRQYPAQWFWVHNRWKR